MKRRNFIQLSVMAAVAAVLPKGETPRAAITFPAEQRIGDSWGTLLTNKDFGEVGPHWFGARIHVARDWAYPENTVVFFNTSELHA